MIINLNLILLMNLINAVIETCFTFILQNIIISLE